MAFESWEDYAHSTRFVDNVLGREIYCCDEIDACQRVRYCRRPLTIKAKAYDPTSIMAKLLKCLLCPGIFEGELNHIDANCRAS